MCRAIPQQDIQTYLAALEVEEITSAADLRAAYYDRIKDLHPDVNPDRDTTEEAAAVNNAYAALVEVARCIPLSLEPAVFSFWKEYGTGRLD